MGARYVIVYEDGSGGLETYTDVDAAAGKPPPQRGVQVVAREDREVGRKLVYRAPFYWWLEDKQIWRGGDLYGLLDWLLDSGRFMLGRSMEDGEFLEAMKLAKEHPHLPPKSAISRTERDQLDETREE